MSLRLGQETEWVWAESASANFFEVLGVTPAYGRFFRRTRTLIRAGTAWW